MAINYDVLSRLIIYDIYRTNGTYSESLRAEIEPTGGQSANKWFGSPRKSQHTENPYSSKAHLGRKHVYPGKLCATALFPLTDAYAETRYFALITTYFLNNEAKIPTEYENWQSFMHS